MKQKNITFLFGYEESYGYLIKPFARDKDAIQSVLAITEAAAYYKMQGKTLLDVLHDLFERHGYYFEGLVSVTKKGADGARAIQKSANQFAKSTFNRNCRHCDFFARRLFNANTQLC